MTRSMLTLLIVEHFPADRELYQQYLQADVSYVYRFLEADSVRDGLELCRTQEIDAIILNYVLPDASGLEFLEALHAQSNGNSPPVLMVSDEGEENVSSQIVLRNAVQAIKLGAEDYLIKCHLTPQVLLLTMQSAIENARKRLQVRQNDDRFRVSVENMLDCFGIYEAIRDKSGQIVDFRFDYLNAAALESNQMTRVDIGKSLCEVFPVHRETDLFAEYCRVVETGEPLIKEDMIYSDVFGTQQLTRAYDVRASKLGDGFVASWRDVTARKRTEETVRRQLGEIEAIYTAAPIGLCFIDTNLRFVRINEQLAQINGLPISEHLGRTLREVLPEIADKLEPLYRQVIVSGEPLKNLEVQGTDRAQPGVDRYCQVCYYPQKDDFHRVLGVNVMVQEITERKQAERQLRESEERFQQLVRYVPHLLWISEPMQQRLLYASSAYEQIWGRPLAAVYADYGQWMSGIHPEDRERVEAHFAETILWGDYNIEYRIVRPDGSIRWIYDRGFPIPSKSGEVRRVAGIAEDITERKQWEQEREQLLAQAEAARIEAEAANRSKDEFVAIVAHELRSPLNSVLGWAKLLRSSNFDAATTAKALLTIERNTQAQVQLVEDLLDISRMVKGTLHLNLVAVNLVEVIETALDSVRPMAAAKQIHLKTQLTQEPYTYGDFNRLQQILVNLLTNAIKFTPNQGQVDIELQQIKSQVQIRISDTGKGIAPEFLPSIFERFQQGQRNTRSTDGLGLGLAIVKHLVELHAGIITAESQGVGQGAAFTVQLPLLQSVKDSPDNSVVCDGACLAGTRILVVDDEPDMLDLITFVLEESGAEVQSATSGLSALECLPQFKPDIVVSDIAMPEGNGYELVQQMKSHPEGQIPAIALTAYASNTHQERSLQAGFAQYLTKPVEPLDLVAAIINLLKAKKK
jgi:PAS domain S-box-containing protein